MLHLLHRWMARRSPLLRRTWTPEQHAAADKDHIGRHGERIARTWLTARGCRVLYCNYKGPHGGEIDIACRDRDTLTFIEVKTRTSTAFGRPAQAVTAEKRELIIRGAKAWLHMLDAEVKFRFDIVEVLLIPGHPPDVNRLTAAFSTEGVADHARDAAA